MCWSARRTDLLRLRRSHALLVGLLAAACLMLLPGAGLFEANAQTTPPQADEAEAQLASVEQAITQIEDWLNTTRRQQSAGEAELADISRTISRLDADMRRTRADLAALDTELAALQSQRTELLARSAAQRDQVALSLRAAWMAGDDSVLKLLLNQQDAQQAQRMLHYLTRINEENLAQIRAWQHTLDALTTNAETLEQQQSRLLSLQQQLADEQHDLQTQQQARQTVLAELEQAMRARSAELQQLQQDRADLQALIEEINRILVDIPEPDALMPFADSRGNLPWPLRGTLLARFGERYGGGNLQRQGIIIGADAGTPVRAVHPGRVVFADWLRGSGNLVVVDHGNAYITLYAHQQSLAKQSGDWVNAGEAIGVAGTDAGTGSPGVYFEVRRNSQTLNPVDWLTPAD